MDMFAGKGRLVVRDSEGVERELRVFQEPRNPECEPRRREWLRWARDENGGWYSWNEAMDALVESSSGRWFSVVQFG
ncbi:hypothetical protein [Tahibacter amnicola]|uniref:Uncharacterized protein n=1 Tax=Tahibacter amnicola TaxID=2976241 RepID=A0ABY6BIG4_9GAMM|nr:hypothetical protein [Tahibacter amnicola]UXI68411.1 hypothetical protein N4264_01790 [Tahibacter amnicola]